MTNVFGIPVTDDIVKTLPEYSGHSVITRLDRAKVAVLKKNEGGKHINALNYAQGLYEQHFKGARGGEVVVTAICTVYNATGDTVNYITAHNWHGRIGSSPYPHQLANGQWGAFVHVRDHESANGVEAGVVYRGKNEAGNGMDWLLCWSVPLGPQYKNKAYTMVREVDHFVGDNEWNAVYDLVNSADDELHEEYDNCVSHVSIGTGEHPHYNAILTLNYVAR